MKLQKERYTPVCAAVRKELSGEIDRWMKASDDALLKGDVPPNPVQAEQSFRHNNG